ncbi:stage II sporulation protein D [Neomoorella mulderi]|uniref:Amidase enhancer n=1 Tax=Moorella mulderi DSM 14980 TaxID=1122241 RepID=A0A151B143_9FIRM|nr:stage II sporulation protein D [Moorella mulderi]KYH33606.1 amidase enhancer precursor [Moorella mulderi DSM 14980]
MRKVMGIFIILIFAAVIIVPAMIIEGIRLFQPPVQVQTGQQLVRVYFHQNGDIKILPLEQYITGVVAGEMPANFEPEALKAQAVAARTYTLKKIEEARNKPDDRHPGADICTDPAHCQAFADDSLLRQRWGFFNFWRYKSKIQEAVRATQGMVLTYQGKLIDPVYHANSGGRTESAAAVWGRDLPYLQSVPSPWDKEAPRYHDTISFTLEELDRKLGVNLTSVPAAALAPSGGTAMKVLEKTPTGRVKTIKIGNKTFAATELRQLLGLPSTDFTWQVQGDRMIFNTTGYGHGVGMSQYGADGMAREGKNFADILTYYYRGVKIESR